MEPNTAVWPNNSVGTVSQEQVDEDMFTPIQTKSPIMQALNQTKPVSGPERASGGLTKNLSDVSAKMKK